MKKFGAGVRGRQSALPAPRHLPLVDILVDAQAELQELVVASGLKVLAAMLEEDRVAVCGPRYAHQPARRASRAGHAPSEVVLGGRKVALRRPRVRRDGQEVALPSVQAFTNTDPLTRRVVEQMLIGVATRPYGRSLEPLGADVRTGGHKQECRESAICGAGSRRNSMRGDATPLEDLELVALLVDGVHVTRQLHRRETYWVSINRAPNGALGLVGRVSGEHDRVSGLADHICRAVGCGPIVQ